MANGPDGGRISVSCLGLQSLCLILSLLGLVSQPRRCKAVFYWTRRGGASTADGEKYLAAIVSESGIAFLI